MIAVALLLFVIVLASSLAFLLLRHWLLSVLVAIAPVLGYLAVLFADFFGWQFAINPYLVFCGWGVAIAMADEFVVAHAGGGDLSSSMRFANWRIVPSAVALAICVLSPIAGGVSDWMLSLRISLPLVFVIASTVAVMQLAPALPYGENFISSVNRFREGAERKTDFLLRIVQHRWAFATSGIALVFITLAIFGQQPPPLEFLSERSNVWVWLLSLFLGAGLLFALARDWRVTVAAALVLALSMLIGLPSLAPPWLTVIFIAFITFQIATYVRRGDEMDLAVAQTLTRSSVGFIAAAVIAVLFEIGLHAVGVLGWNFDIYDLHSVFVSAVGMLSALIVLPAFAVAIETLFPRRETLEARYKVH